MKRRDRRAREARAAAEGGGPRRLLARWTEWDTRAFARGASIAGVSLVLVGLVTAASDEGGLGWGVRAGRTRTLEEMAPVTLAAADPMNLVGVVIPGESPACIAGNTVTLPLPLRVSAVTETVVAEIAVTGTFGWDRPALEGGARA